MRIEEFAAHMFIYECVQDGISSDDIQELLDSESLPVNYFLEQEVRRILKTELLNRGL